VVVFGVSIQEQAVLKMLFPDLLRREEQLDQADDGVVVAAGARFIFPAGVTVTVSVSVEATTVVVTVTGATGYLEEQNDWAGA
jgi:hypothetical protein